MEKDEAISVLRKYEDELSGILGRFRSTHDEIFIDQKDDPRFRQLVIELRDLLNDMLGKNTYSMMIVNLFNEGMSNFYESPSYKSVEGIRGVVSSVITRIERNPQILSPSPDVQDKVPRVGPTGPEFPEKVTLSWLVRHVPVSFWITSAGLLVAAFVAGVQASRISLVKEIFRLETQQQDSHPQPEKVDRALAPAARFPFDLQIDRAKQRIKYLSYEYLHSEVMSLVEVAGSYGDNVLDSPNLYDWPTVMEELEKQGYIKILKRTGENIEFKVIRSREKWDVP